MPGVEGQKAQLLEKCQRPVFYAVEQVGQVAVKVVVDLHALAVRRPAEQHPAPTAKDFDISAEVLREEPVNDIAEGFLAAHPADKAIDIPSPPPKKRRADDHYIFSDIDSSGLQNSYSPVSSLSK